MMADDELEKLIQARVESLRALQDAQQSGDAVAIAQANRRFEDLRREWRRRVVYA